MSRDTQLRIRRIKKSEAAHAKCSRCKSSFQFVAERPGWRRYYWCPECDVARPK